MSQEHFFIILRYFGLLAILVAALNLIALNVVWWQERFEEKVYINCGSHDWECERIRDELFGQKLRLDGLKKNIETLGESVQGLATIIEKGKTENETD